MRRQENIYIQTESSCVRNKDILNVNTSSDICVFESPLFIMTGATKIMSGITSTDTSVHIVPNDATTIDINFSFTGNLNSFTFEEFVFRYDTYKLYDNEFLNPPIYSSPNYPNPSTSGYAVSSSIPIDKLALDGEYLLKGNYDYKVCTTILNKLGLRNTTFSSQLDMPYNLYNKTYDYYFIAVREADTPVFNLEPVADRTLGSLASITFIVEGKETDFLIDSPVQGSIVVSLNGLILALNEDYSFSGGVVSLKGETVAEDIVNCIYVSNGVSNGLLGQNIQISGFIPSGPTDGQGSNLAYYNTTTNKFEIYTKTNPTAGSQIIVTLNGVTLANGIDYYQSKTDSKRIILEGSLVGGDIIGIIYNGFASYVGNVDTTAFSIHWSIPNAPQNTNGKFITQVATDKSFNTMVYTGITNYVTGQLNYDSGLVLTGKVGTELVYRVVNEKNYITISNDIIQTMAYSETIPIKINTNKINSY